MTDRETAQLLLNDIDANPALSSILLHVDYEKDELEIVVPGDVEVVQRCTNNVDDGTTVIFRERRR